MRQPGRQPPNYGGDNLRCYGKRRAPCLPRSTISEFCDDPGGVYTSSALNLGSAAALDPAHVARARLCRLLGPLPTPGGACWGAAACGRGGAAPGGIWGQKPPGGAHLPAPWTCGPRASREQSRAFPPSPGHTVGLRVKSAAGVGSGAQPRGPRGAAGERAEQVGRQLRGSGTGPERPRGRR